MMSEIRFYTTVVVLLRQIASVLAMVSAVSIIGNQAAHAGCTDPVAPNVDWSRCDKSGAELNRGTCEIFNF